MAIFPAAMFPIIMGTKNGLTHSGPLEESGMLLLEVSTRHARTESYAQALGRVGISAGVAGQPGVFHGLSSGDHSVLVKRSIRFLSLRSIYGSGSNPDMAGCLAGQEGAGSNLSILPIPHCPARAASQNVFHPHPRGVTAPIPVTTTRLLK